MSEKAALHFGGIDVFAARDNHVLHAILNIDETVLVYISGIPGVKPAGADCSGGCLGIVPVALHYHGTSHYNLSDDSGRHFLSLEIHYPDFHAEEWLPAGFETPGTRPVEVMILEAQACHPSCDFCQTIDLKEFAPEKLHGASQQVLGNRGGAVRDCPEAGVVCRSGILSLKHEEEGGRHQ